MYGSETVSLDFSPHVKLSYTQIQDVEPWASQERLSDGYTGPGDIESLRPCPRVTPLQLTWWPHKHAAAFCSGVGGDRARINAAPNVSESLV